jgi:hypothetical protein
MPPYSMTVSVDRRSSVQCQSHQETALHETEEEACDDKSGEAFHEAHTHSHNSPADNECREIIACSEILQNQVARDVN